MKKKLPHCPFCNSRSYLIEICEGQFTVMCSTCGASSEWYSGFEAVQEACNALNTRVYEKNLKLVYALSIILSTIAFSISVISAICRCLGYL